MNIFRAIIIAVVALILIGGAGYLYASSGTKSKAGYAKLVKPTGASVDTILSLNIGPGGVAPARWLIEKIAADTENEHDMPERIARSLLQELQGVQLRIYEVHDNREVYDAAISESVVALKKKSWETVILVREDEDKIVVMQIGDDTHIAGLSIMASTPDKAVFVNLIGPFSPESIAATLQELNKGRP